MCLILSKDPGQVNGTLATWYILTEHLYVGVITVVLPVMAPALGLNMAQAGF